MAKFILRVDDCGWNPDKGDDRDLAYFRQWRDAFGIAGLPVYYGFIPATLGVRELAWLHDNLTVQEQVAVHGWDHAVGPVDRNRMEYAADLFRAAGLFDRFYPTYIPPFNAYDAGTVAEWREAATKFPEEIRMFFGGFPDDLQSVNYGLRPTLHYGNMIHLPAFRPLYERAGPILERLNDHLSFDYPVVVTLHATWDAKNLAALRPLRDALAPHLIDVSAVCEWLIGGAK